MKTKSLRNQAPKATSWIITAILAALIIKHLGDLLALIFFATTAEISDTKTVRQEIKQGNAIHTLFGGSHSSGHEQIIKLKGIIALPRDTSNGAAILEIDNKAPKIFYPGKTLGPGTKLLEVNATSITIEQDGLRESIKMPNAKSGGS